jgi:5,10-methylenetetrahydrofolate reductase
MNKHIEGTFIPDSIIDQLMRASDKQEESIRIAANLIKEMKPFCQGVQIIPIGWENLIPPLLDQLRLS